MEARLQDVLHLVAWNGYSKDIDAGISSTRETWTDDRLVFPFGIQHKYANGKTRLQILFEKDETKAFNRLEQLIQMANHTNHMPILNKVLNSTDNDGHSPLTAAINQKSTRLVKILLNHGVNVNQTNKKGRSPLNLAEELHSIYRRDNDTSYEHCMNLKDIVGILKENGAIDIPEERKYGSFTSLRHFIHNYRIHNYRIHNYRWNLYVNDDTHTSLDLYTGPRAVPPKPKRLKKSLYMRQFGR